MEKEKTPPAINTAKFCNNRRYNKDILRFPDMGVPYIIHFIFGMSLTNHPFWGTPIYGNPHLVFFGVKLLRKHQGLSQHLSDWREDKCLTKKNLAMVCWIIPLFNGGVDGNIIYTVVAGNTNYKWL